jgi:hypothetical protein
VQARDRPPVFLLGGQVNALSAARSLGSRGLRFVSSMTAVRAVCSLVHGIVIGISTRHSAPRPHNGGSICCSMREVAPSYFHAATPALSSWPGTAAIWSGQGACRSKRTEKRCSLRSTRRPPIGGPVNWASRLRIRFASALSTTEWLASLAHWQSFTVFDLSDIGPGFTAFYRRLKSIPSRLVRASARVTRSADARAGEHNPNSLGGAERQARW